MRETPEKSKTTVKTRAQVEALEKCYNENMNPSKLKREEIAKSIGLTEKQVSKWFYRVRFQHRHQRRPLSGAISSDRGEKPSRSESSSSDTGGAKSQSERPSPDTGKEKSRSENERPSSESGEKSGFESPSMDSVMTVMKGLQSSVEYMMVKQNELMQMQMTFELEFHSFALRMETQIADLRSDLRRRRC